MISQQNSSASFTITVNFIEMPLFFKALSSDWLPYGSKNPSLTVVNICCSKYESSQLAFLFSTTTIKPQLQKLQDMIKSSTGWESCYHDV